MARFAMLFGVECPPLDSGSGAGTTVIQRFPRGVHVPPRDATATLWGFSGSPYAPRHPFAQQGVGSNHDQQ